MVKVTRNGINEGLVLMQIMEICLKSHNCLWLSRPKLFQETNTLPYYCPKERCLVVIFRKTFENDSPAFYAEALRASLFASTVQTPANAIPGGGKAKKKRARKLRRRIHDLRVFGQLVALSLHPLFYENKRFPFLTSAEIKTLRNNYHASEIHKTLKKMTNADSEWIEWLDLVRRDLLSADKRYPMSMVYLAYLFIKGLEKDQLPDLTNMSQEEKDKFFVEIFQKQK